MYLNISCYCHKSPSLYQNNSAFDHSHTIHKNYHEKKNVNGKISVKIKMRSLDSFIHSFIHTFSQSDNFYTTEFVVSI